MLNASNPTAARPNIRTASVIESYSSQKRIMTALHCWSFPTTAAHPHAVGESLAAPSISVNGLRALSTCLITSIRQGEDEHLCYAWRECRMLVKSNAGAGELFAEYRTMTIRSGRAIDAACSFMASTMRLKQAGLAAILASSPNILPSGAIRPITSNTHSFLRLGAWV